MSDILLLLSLSNEIEVKRQLRNYIGDTDFENNKGTNKSYPSAVSYSFVCGRLEREAPFETSPIASTSSLKYESRKLLARKY